MASKNNAGGKSPLTGTPADDNITGGNSADIIKGLQGNDTVSGGGKNDTLYGDDTDSTYVGHDLLDGGLGNDKLYGVQGNDTLIGGAGADSMYGGLGDDTYAVDSTNDVVSESTTVNEGTDTVISSVDYDLGSRAELALVENLTLNAAALKGIGNALNNILQGNEQANTLDGAAGNDTILGGAGNDTITGGADSDTAMYSGDRADYLISATSGDYTIADQTVDRDGTDTLSGIESLTFADLTMNLGSNNPVSGTVTISGAAEEDQTLTATATLSDPDGLGALSYQWQANGTDIAEATDSSLTLDQAQVGQRITVTARYTDGFGTQELVTSSATEMVANVNDAPNGEITVSGLCALGQTLTANTANLTDSDGLGTFSYQWQTSSDNGDTWTALSGATADTYTLTVAEVGHLLRVVVSYSDGGGTVESVPSAASELIAHIRGNDSDEILQGTEDIDILAGAGGNDTILGGGANDTLLGGTGDDTFQVDDTGDVVIEAAGEGTDTVRTSLQVYTLGANLENLEVSGGSAATVAGNDCDNGLCLFTNYTNDTIDGGAGADTMTGGHGDDTYIVDNSADLVREEADAGRDTVLSCVDHTLAANVENLCLTASGLTATGNELDNTFTILASGCTIVEALDEGTDTVESHVDFTLGDNVENLVLAAKGITGTGNHLDNTFIVNHADNTIIESATGGTDTVVANLQVYRLPDNIETLVMSNYWGGPVQATGNDLNNQISLCLDLFSNDSMDGGAGADTMAAGNGDDTYTVDDTHDLVREETNAGRDTVRSSVDYALAANLEVLILTGTETINGTGNDLDNLLAGNAAANVLIGGGGNDLFLFAQPLDGTSAVDTIADFIVGADTIALEDSVFTALTFGSLPADSFRSGQGLTAAATAYDRVLYNLDTGDLYYDADGNGEGSACVCFATLTGIPALSEASFFVC